MIRLDHAFLTNVGLGDLPPASADATLRHIHSTLEMRVGMRITRDMTDQQLDAFEALIDAGDQVAALSFLEIHRPDYRQLVREELQRLREELRAHAGQLLACAR